MKINVKILIEKEACEEIINYFIKTFGRNAEIDVYKVIEKCHEDKNNYFEWLYKKFQLTGKSVYYENGQIKKKGNWKDGKRDGEWVYYYESGQIKEKDNWKGRELGVEWYYKNGQVKQKANWKNGRENGEWVEYYESGEVKVEQYWKDGKRIFCFDYSKQQNT